MSQDWSFRFSLPEIPEGKPITQEEAEKILLKQLETRERDREQVIWDLARLYSVTGRQDIAFACVKQLVSATDAPEKKAGYCLAMGQLSEQMKDYKSAIRYYSEAMSLEPMEQRTW